MSDLYFSFKLPLESTTNSALLKSTAVPSSLVILIPLPSPSCWRCVVLIAAFVLAVVTLYVLTKLLRPPNPPTAAAASLTRFYIYPHV